MKLRSMTLWLMCGLAAFGCEQDDASMDANSQDTSSGDMGDDGEVPDMTEPDLSPLLCDTGVSVVQFMTSDGVTLEADLNVVTQGGPVALLFHMIPPSNSRSNYPSEFIDALTAAGVNVLNVDRRGAGASEGVAIDAYQGPGGALDVAGAVSFVEGHDCEFDMARIALVGASNGTTSTFDFVASQDTLPAALVWLTPGTYTEAQQTVASQSERLADLPVLVVWTPAEAAAEAWIRPLVEDAPSSWQFSTYTPGGHGTRMFSSKPESVGEIAAWIVAAL